MDYISARRQEEKDRRREEILDAAERVFAMKDYDVAKMDDIAREARVSRALVYVYFSDKSELQFNLCLRGLELLRQRFVEACRRNAMGVDQVSAIGRAYVGFAQEFPVYFSALSRFEAHRPEEMDAVGTEAQCMLAGRAVHEVTAAALTRGQQDGSIRADIANPMLVAITLWGFMHGVIQLMQTKGEMMVQQGLSVQAILESAINLASFGVAARPT